MQKAVRVVLVFNQILTETIITMLAVAAVVVFSQEMVVATAV
jgi:hypothetical protein